MPLLFLHLYYCQPFYVCVLVSLILTGFHSSKQFFLSFYSFHYWDTSTIHDSYWSLRHWNHMKCTTLHQHAMILLFSLSIKPQTNNNLWSTLTFYLQNYRDCVQSRQTRKKESKTIIVYVKMYIWFTPTQPALFLAMSYSVKISKDSWSASTDHRPSDVWNQLVEELFDFLSI